MKDPFVSVIMPVYNCELYVKDAIQSILEQTYENFEFLIIIPQVNLTRLPPLGLLL